jgi:hypothetical protein
MTRYMVQARRVAGAFILMSGVAAAACGGITELDVTMPPAQEFGLGPRASADGRYVARVEPGEPIRVNRLHAWRLDVRDRDGNVIAGATITVDGGMPQHGHGLPTRPRVTKDLGNGGYEVDGMRFNMGGWWVVTFRITTSAGTDDVTFNLML